MKNRTTILTIVAATLVVAVAFIAGPLLNSYFGDKKDSHSDMNMTSKNSDNSLIQKDSADYKMYAAFKGDV